MKIILTILALVASTQALPLWSILSHRNLINPVFKKAFYKSQPSVPTSRSHPYHVMICIDDGGLCSGILVAPDKVLTSAQCVTGASTFELHLGRLYLYDDELNDALETTTSSRAIIHPDFTRTFENAVHDLALILLDAPVSKTPAVLPKKSDNFPLDEYRSVYVVGYGQADASEITGMQSMQPFLSESYMASLLHNQCKGILGTALDTPDRHFCAYAPAISSCYGDPGSPLLMSNTQGQLALAGIASFGSKDFCETGAPIVFTNVRTYISWLEANGIPIED
ncbi:brachyurin-like [Neocloeon triangulifer]|uniref:brachyurin-like n=1 Tax=Neocloeon triangulifer TaxID=2078957 RepID=UPI00286F76A1|nr:brachyurin-like [Neocloeon triangulifer]